MDVDEDCDGLADEAQGLVCCVLIDVDGDGQVLPLTDALLLLLRWAFGFTGDNLIRGAVGQGCTRYTAVEIVDYIEQTMLAPH